MNEIISMRINELVDDDQKEDDESIGIGNTEVVSHLRLKNTRDALKKILFIRKIRRKNMMWINYATLA